MKKVLFFPFVTLTILLASCSEPKSETSTMQMNFQTADSSFFPIEMHINSISNDSIEFTFYNGEEEIRPRIAQTEQNRIRVEMPVFESYFELERTEYKHWKGHYYDPSRGDQYRIQVYTSSGNDQWRDSEAPPQKTYAFHYGKDLEFSGYAFLRLEKGQLRGTIRSEIGDYRYLSGWIAESNFQLQTFDGSHVYHWNGEIQPDGKISGMYYSGNHFRSPFELIPVDDVKFNDSDALTEVVSPIRFKLPLSPADSLTYPSEKFDGKVVMIQVLGSWCPNCMDETRFISERLYPEFHEAGFEVIGIAFERYREDERNFDAIAKMKRDLNVSYPVVLGGFADKREAGEVLPFLSEIISFPTTILIDQNGSIVRVHTGFDGPGTGEPYEAYVDETVRLIEDLIHQ